MDWQNQIITVYLTNCNFFSQLSPKNFVKVNTNSNPMFSDEETIIIYIFEILNNLKNVKSIFNFTKKFLSQWFPYLPSYEEFLSNLKILIMFFHELIKFLLKNDKFKPVFHSSINITLIDSLPIMLTKFFRSYKYNNTKDISSIMYYASKNVYYYKLRLHLIATYRNKKLSAPKYVKITQEITDDLRAIKKVILLKKF